MKKSTSFLLLGALMLVPALSVWILGFLGMGAGVESAARLLQGFHAMPYAMQIVIEGVLPLFSIGLSMVALFETKRNHNSAIVILIVGMLLVAAFGLGTAFGR